MHILLYCMVEYDSNTRPPNAQLKKWAYRKIAYSFISRGGAVWQLVGLITQRSQVQILPPQPNNFIEGPVVQLVRMPACHAGGRGFESRPDRLFAIIYMLKNMYFFMRKITNLVLQYVEVLFINNEHKHTYYSYKSSLILVTIH